VSSSKDAVGAGAASLDTTRGAWDALDLTTVAQRSAVVETAAAAALDCLVSEQVVLACRFIDGPPLPADHRRRPLAVELTGE
jgi:hypothetical protein